MALEVSKPDESGNLSLGMQVLSQTHTLASQISNSRQELSEMRMYTYIFLTTSAVIGFLTTVVAAANAWRSTNNPATGALRIFGVVLPALGTLVVALASIYAPVDAVSRKAQLLSGLISLQGELGAMLAQNKCTNIISASTEFSKSYADWNKRLAGALAAAELPQTSSAQGRSDDKPKRDDNPEVLNEKPAETTIKPN